MKRKLCAKSDSVNSFKPGSKKSLSRVNGTGKCLKHMLTIYYILAALRLVLVFVPQTGYIHPDEYFQSIELMAGDVFDVDHIRAWEFNRTEPVRSILVPILTVGVPYKLLKSLDHMAIGYLGYSVITPYFLLVLPRLLICLISFLVDYSLYKICIINREAFQPKLTLLSSSYVMFVYGTRTFSNTVEMALLSILLFLVAESQVRSKEVIAQDEYLTDRYNKSKITVDKVRFYKLRMLLPPHSLRHCIAISIITVTGVFNRPTFIAFALCPIFFWFHRGLGSKSVRFAQFHYRMFLFLSCSAITVICYIVVDSIYFGYLTMSEIDKMDIGMKNFVVTPLNFIRYNMDMKKLSEHGLHPRTLHLLVNIPLLYNVLGIVTVGNIVLMFYRLLMGQYTSLPQIHSTRGMMAASIIAPVSALSYFPHQEPRFLIPITLPIVYLFSNVIIRKSYINKMWVFLNVVCLLFYGFIHQAGLYPATVHLSNEVSLSRQTTKPVYLITSHVYNLPVSFFQHHNPQKIYSSGQSRYMKSRTFFLQELGGSSLTIVTKHLNTIIQKSYEVKKKPKIYLLLPTSKAYELEQEVFKNNLTIIEAAKFYPHVSTEALPNFMQSIQLFYEDNSIYNFFTDILCSCGLGLYQIKNDN